MERRRIALALAVLPLALTAAPARPDAPATAPPSPQGPLEAHRPGPLPVLDGVVRAVDLAHHTVSLDVGGAPVVLSFDRNTLVYLPGGLSSVSELKPGEVVRAGRDERFVAYWVQVRSLPPGPAAVHSTPGQGTGPGGGAPAPPEGARAPSSPVRGGEAPPASSPGPG